MKYASHPLYPQNRELQIMRRLEHCNIVRLRYFFYSGGVSYTQHTPHTTSWYGCLWVDTITWASSVFGKEVFPHLCGCARCLKEAFIHWWGSGREVKLGHRWLQFSVVFQSICTCRSAISMRSLTLPPPCR